MFNDDKEQQKGLNNYSGFSKSFFQKKYHWYITHGRMNEFQDIIATITVQGDKQRISRSTRVKR